MDPIGLAIIGSTGAIGKIHIDDFAKAIIHNRDPSVTGEEGRKAQEVVAAITMSGCLGTKISLPVDRSEYDVLLESLIANRRLPDS